MIENRSAGWPTGSHSVISSEKKLEVLARISEIENFMVSSKGRDTSIGAL